MSKTVFHMPPGVTALSCPALFDPHRPLTIAEVQAFRDVNLAGPLLMSLQPEKWMAGPCIWRRVLLEELPLGPNGFYRTSACINALANLQVKAPTLGQVLAAFQRMTDAHNSLKTILEEYSQTLAIAQPPETPAP